MVASGGGGSSPTDVLTTQGDILSQNPSGTYVRIPKGSNGQLLTLTAGIPAYTGAPSGTILDWQWTLDNTSGTNPGSGDMAINNANYGLVTQVKFGGGTVNNSGDPSTYFILINAVAGTNKAYLTLWNSTSRRKWAVYSVQATSSGGTYMIFTVTALGWQDSPVPGDNLYARVVPTA